MKRVVLGVAVLAALAFLAAGCGGGGSKELTAEEYSAHLNAICQEVNDKQKEIGEFQSVQDIADKGPELLDKFKEAVGEAKDLNPPAELQDPHDEFIGLADQTIDLLDDLIAAAQDGDEAKVQEVGAKLDPIDKQSDKIASEELNAPACAED